MENLKQQIEEIEAQQEELAKKKGELYQKIAELLCPFKLGDVGTVGGYAHNGKKAKVVSIEHSPIWDWEITVVLFKADGKAGVIQKIIYKEENFILDGVK